MSAAMQYISREKKTEIAQFVKLFVCRNFRQFDAFTLLPEKVTHITLDEKMLCMMKTMTQMITHRKS